MNHTLTHLLLAGCVCTVTSCSSRHLSLVPDTPSQAPDYLCTWSMQGYSVSFTGAENTRAAMTEQSIFGRGKWEGWIEMYPGYVPTCIS